MKIVSLLLMTFLFYGCLSSDPGSLEDAAGQIPGATTGVTTGGGSDNSPTIPVVIPQLGSTTVATNVSVRGLNFVAGQMSVEFGGVPCTNPAVLSSTQITCSVAPQAAGAVGVEVKKNGEELFSLESGFVFVPEPGAVFGIVSVTPYLGSVAGGTTITLIGSSFTSGMSVRIDGNLCSNISTISSALATCQTPAGSVGPKEVILTKGAETVSMVNGFRYVGSPSLSVVSPASGPATLGTNITLSGSNLVSGALVTIETTVGTYYCQNVTVAMNGDSLTCLVPVITASLANTITNAAKITVINPDGQVAVLNSAFTYLKPPVYSNSTFTGGVSAPPVDGTLNNAGTAITWDITGVNFSSGVLVRINGAQASGCARISSALIRCTTSTPNLGSETGSYPITIVNSDGQFDSRVLTFAGRPIISSTTPAVVGVGATTDVVLNGSNLASHDSSNPIIRVRNPANTAEIGVCSVISNTFPVSCTFPNLNVFQSNLIRFTNSYGYRIDYSSIPTTFLAELIVSYPVGVGDIGGEGKIELGRIPPIPYKMGVRFNNLSSSFPVTAFSVDTSALAGTPYTLDTVNTTCGTTIAPSGYCDLIFDFSASSLVVADATDPIIVSYNNGASVKTRSFTIGKVATVPLKPSRKKLDFGDIPHGLNHEGVNPGMIKVLQIHNRSDRNINLNLATTEFTSSEFRYAGGGAFPGYHPASYARTFSCPASGIITPDLKCSIFLEYRPTLSGAQIETFNVRYGNYTLPIELKGASSRATVATCNPAGTPFGGGSGTALSPYLLCSSAQIKNMATDKSKYFLMTSDIDLSNDSTVNINLSSVTTPSELDGGGYLVKMGTITTNGIFNISDSLYTMRNLQVYGVIASNISTGLLFGTAASISRNVNLINSAVVGEGSFTAAISSAAGIISSKGGSANLTIDNVQLVMRLETSEYNTRLGYITTNLAGGKIIAHQLDVFGYLYTLQNKSGVIGSVESGAEAVLTDVIRWGRSANAGGGGAYGGVMVAEIIGLGSKLTINGCESNTLTTGIVGGIIGTVRSSVSVLISKCADYGYNIGGRASMVNGIESGSSTLMERSFSVSKFESSGHQTAAIGTNLASGTFKDIFFAGKTFAIGNASAAGFYGVSSAVRIQNTYIANIFNEKSFYGTAVNILIPAFANAAFTDPAICSYCFYQLGTGNDVSPDPSTVFPLTKSQMMSNMPGIHGSPNWKTITGYPYPVLEWMDDDFMP